jgi:hypothetical protein
MCPDLDVEGKKCAGWEHEKTETQTGFWFGTLLCCRHHTIMVRLFYLFNNRLRYYDLGLVILEYDAFWTTDSIAIPAIAESIKFILLCPCSVRLSSRCDAPLAGTHCRTMHRYK